MIFETHGRGDPLDSGRYNIDRWWAVGHQVDSQISYGTYSDQVNISSHEVVHSLIHVEEEKVVWKGMAQSESLHEKVKELIFFHHLLLLLIINKAKYILI